MEIGLIFTLFRPLMMMSNFCDTNISLSKYFGHHFYT